MQVFFLAKGTRGDVQPVVLLAHALRARNPRLVLQFVTHLDHQVPTLTDLPADCSVTIICSE